MGVRGQATMTDDHARDAADPQSSGPLNPEAIDAVLFDLDGVITRTAMVHARAWKMAFDEFLRQRSAGLDGSFEPFRIDHDYMTYVDGKSRSDGVIAFLQSRGISLAPGRPDDPPDRNSVHGIGNRKNAKFLQLLENEGVPVYGTSLDLVRSLRAKGLKTGLVSSSRNCAAILDVAGIADLFDVRVDGVTAADYGLKGKPAPDTFLEAARSLGVEPSRAVVVEDALAGVEAGRAGNFARVVGIARFAAREDLRARGADIVVDDLAELESEAMRQEELEAPSALSRLPEIKARLCGRQLAVFLDYDGTLTPIVARPELAVLADATRATLGELSKWSRAVAIVSGRARDDVQALVDVPTLLYAGSHGFDIADGSGRRIYQSEAQRFVPIIKQAAQALRDQIGAIDGVIIEDKVFALAVHYRLVADRDLDQVRQGVDEVEAEHAELRRQGGKKIFEFLPAIEWDKGKAIRWLLRDLDLETPDVVPLYFGDDVTDRSAFRALRGRGIGFLVAEAVQPTAAHYRLKDPGEVNAFLRALIAQLERRPA